MQERRGKTISNRKSIILKSLIDYILNVGKNDDRLGPESNRGISGCDDDVNEGGGVMSEVGEDLRYRDAIYYKDVNLLVVRGPDSGGHDGSPPREQEAPEAVTRLITSNIRSRDGIDGPSQHDTLLH